MTLAIIIDDMATAEDIISKYHNRSDIIFELRLDKDEQLLNLLDLESFDKSKFIVTLRSKNEGGNHKEVEQRAEVLSNALAKSPGFLDIEVHRDLDLLDVIISKSTIPIYSYHNFDRPMIEASKYYLQVINKYSIPHENAIFKFVGNPTTTLDLFISEQLLRILPRKIVLGTGTAGELSRTSRKFRNEFIFAAPDPSYNILTVGDLLPIYETDQPLITGLIGADLSHSISPVIHQLLRKSTDISGYYHLFELPDKKTVIDFVKTSSTGYLTGLNVTFPYKKTVTEIAEVIDNSVTKTGNANTLHFENDEIQAFNTDYSGFRKFIEMNQIDKFEHALVIGAGSASQTVAFVLIEKGLNVTIVNRSRDRFESIPQNLRKEVYLTTFSEYSHSPEFDLYINATSLGYQNENPTKYIEIPKSAQIVIDLNYGKNGTPLTREAQNIGILSYDGKELLFHQAADAFEIWTNQSLDRNNLLSKFLSRYENK